MSTRSGIASLDELEPTIDQADNGGKFICTPQEYKAEPQPVEKGWNHKRFSLRNLKNIYKSRKHSATQTPFGESLLVGRCMSPTRHEFSLKLPASILMNSDLPAPKIQRRYY